LAIRIRFDVRSLAAAIFLAVSLYVMTGTDQSSIYTAGIVMAFVMAISVCLYYSYRLVLAINRAD
jgi:hypothetical protein